MYVLFFSHRCVGVSSLFSNEFLGRWCSLVVQDFLHDSREVGSTELGSIGVCEILSLVSGVSPGWFKHIYIRTVHTFLPTYLPTYLPRTYVRIRYIDTKIHT